MIIATEMKTYPVVHIVYLYKAVGGTQHNAQC